MGLSVWQILIVVLLLVLLFGRGKISELMGDMAKGIKSFKKGMAEEDDEPKVARDTDGRQIPAEQPHPVDVTRTRAGERASRAVEDTVEDAETVEERKRDSA
jgi:sec-independent protein translocase protein TatA